MRTESRLKVSKASTITATLSNLVTLHLKKFLYKCLKNTHTVSVFYSLSSVKKTHAEIRMRIYACSVKGNIKQTNENKNFIRIRMRIFYTHIRIFCAYAQIQTFGKSRLTQICTATTTSKCRNLLHRPTKKNFFQKAEDVGSLLG